MEQKICHDLQFMHKKEAENYCKENGTTIKEVILNNISSIEEALGHIKEKIKNNEGLENEDWLKAAVPLRHVMNALGNKWYIE